MSGIFSRPKMPTPPPAPAAPVTPPTVATPQVQAAADAQRMKTRAASGRAATMLTNPEDEERPTVGTRKLLGG